MKTLGISRLTLCAFGMVMFTSSLAAAENPACTDKCTAKTTTCTQAIEKQYTRCIAQTDKWKAGKEKVATKAKQPEKAQARVQADFDKKKLACETAKTKAGTKCTTATERCTKACDKSVKKMKAGTPAKKELVPAKKELVPAKKEVIPAKKEVVPAKKEVVPAKKAAK